MPADRHDLRDRVNELLGHLRVRGLHTPVLEIARKRHCTVGDILDHSRESHIALARAEIWYALRQPPYDLSTPTIGRLFGRDHTTILLAVRRHEKRLTQ